jgi:hypothetical protein
MSEELQTEIDNLRIEIDKNVAMSKASGDDATNDATLKKRRALQARLEVALKEQAEFQDRLALRKSSVKL